MKPCFRRWGWLAACLLASTASGAEWRTQPASSRIEFVATSQGSEFTGRFERFTPRIRFDPLAPAAGSFDVAIELASANTNNAERDQALPTADFFWTEKFPRARFRANGCKAGAAAGRFQCQGTLALRGKTRKVAFPFAWSGDARKARLTASAVLNRLDFGVGTGDWADPATIGHNVTVKITLDLRAAAPATRPSSTTPKP